MAAQSPAIHPGLEEPSRLRPVVPAVSAAASRRHAEGAVASRARAGLGFRRALGWLLDVGGMVALVYAIPLAIVVLPAVLLVRLVMGGLGLLGRDGRRRTANGHTTSPNV